MKTKKQSKVFVCKFCWKVWNWTNFTSQRKSKLILLYITLILTCEFIISSHVRSDRREMNKELFSLCELYCVYKRTIFHILFPPTCEVADHKKEMCSILLFNWINLSFYRQHQFAIRATLLSAETLKARNIYLDAAMQFMRMTAEVKKISYRNALLQIYWIVRQKH